MGKYYTLSKKEKELMELFWDAGCPLSRAEILERAATRKCSWKPNSVHILVNSLLDKKAVRVSGYYLSSRKLGRTFESAITPEDYAVMQVELAAHKAEAEAGLTPPKLMAALMDDNNLSDEVIDQLEAIIANKKGTSSKKKSSKTK